MTDEIKESETKDKESELVRLEKRRQKIQMIFMLLMLVAIVSLIVCIYTIYHYADLLKNPVGYNMERFGLNYCTCYDLKNKIVPIKSIHYNNVSDKFIPAIERISQLPQLNLSLPGN